MAHAVSVAVEPEAAVGQHPLSILPQVFAVPGIVDKARLPYIEAAYCPRRREHPHQAALFVTFHFADVGLYVNRGVATDAAQPHGVETVIPAQAVACAYPDVSAAILGHAVYRVARQPACRRDAPHGISHAFALCRQGCRKQGRGRQEHHGRSHYRRQPRHQGTDYAKQKYPQTTHILVFIIDRNRG